MKLDGSNVLLYYSEDDGVTFTAFAHTESCSLNIDLDLPDATDKDDGGWEDHIAGRRKWSIDVNGMVNNADADANKKVVDLLIGRTQFVARIGIDSSGERYYQGSVHIQNYKDTSPADKTSTWSATLKGKGALTPTDPA